MKFAVVADRSRPGTIDVRHPPPLSNNSPMVINMFAQWELGPALKYNRVPCPAIYGSDSSANRVTWFQNCLDSISNLGGEKPASLAFPFEIGCGLAGGKWPEYEAMIEAFADANPDIQVTIARWLGGNSSSSSRGKGKGSGGRR